MKDDIQQSNIPREHMKLEFELQIGNGRAKVVFQGDAEHYAVVGRDFRDATMLHAQEVSRGVEILAGREQKILPPPPQIASMPALPGYAPQSAQVQTPARPVAPSQQPAITVAAHTLQNTVEAAAQSPSISPQKLLGRWIWPWDLWRNPALKHWKSSTQKWVERGIDAVSIAVIIYLLVTVFGPRILSDVKNFLPKPKDVQPAAVTTPSPKPSATPAPSP